MGIRAACILLPLLVTCSTSPPAPRALGAEDLARLGLVNGRMPFPGIVTGGQLTEEQVDELSVLGFDVLVSLRPTGEGDAGWEEQYAAAHGISFHRIPVAGPAGVSVENARRLASVLSTAGDRGVVVYCASGNRVGALFALKAHALDEMSAEQSLRIGREAGLTRLEPYVRELLGL